MLRPDEEDVEIASIQAINDIAIDRVFSPVHNSIGTNLVCNQYRVHD